VHYSVTCLIGVPKVYKVTCIHHNCGRKSYTWLPTKFKTLNKHVPVFTAVTSHFGTMIDSRQNISYQIFVQKFC
jgi:hypothetical protein